MKSERQRTSYYTTKPKTKKNEFPQKKSSSGEMH